MDCSVGWGQQLGHRCWWGCAVADHQRRQDGHTVEDKGRKSCATQAEPGAVARRNRDMTSPAVITVAGDIGQPVWASTSATQVLQV